MTGFQVDAIYSGYKLKQERSVRKSKIRLIYFNLKLIEQRANYGKVRKSVDYY